MLPPPGGEMLRLVEIPKLPFQKVAKEYSFPHKTSWNLEISPKSAKASTKEKKSLPLQHVITLAHSQELKPHSSTQKSTLPQAGVSSYICLWLVAHYMEQMYFLESRDPCTAKNYNPCSNLQTVNIGTCLAYSLYFLYHTLKKHIM